MQRIILTLEHLVPFLQSLRREEKEPSTIEKYDHDIRAFIVWTQGRELDKELVTGWKEHLIQCGLRSETINAKLAALNKMLAFLGLETYQVKYLKVQRKLFYQTDRELTQEEYQRLLNTASQSGNRRLALLMETICATGIRVSELKYITVEAAQNGRTDIALKGKVRTIVIPGKLCRKLLKYAKQNGIASGEIFLTRRGNSLKRRQIWAEMKALCKKANVAASKVFPHNLRHLFARTFYRVYKDVARLADVLGHSSIETTRIYLISSGLELAHQLERLNLIS